MGIRAPVVKVIGLVLCALALQVSSATAQKEGGKDKDPGKKFEVPKDAIAGTVKAVDMSKSTFTITQKDKKDHTYGVDKVTEFWGPKGGDRGTGPAGLKDDCMDAGYEIHVVLAKDGKTAKDVFFPVRKSTPKKDKK
jgi:hypothetical protein